MNVQIWIYSVWACVVYTTPVSGALEFIKENIPSGSDDENEYNFSGDEEPLAPANNTCNGFLGWGLHVNSALYVNAAFRKVLQIFTITEITAAYKGMTSTRMSAYKEGHKMGSFKSFYISLTAKDEANVFPLFGKKHKTYIICSGSADKNEILKYLATKPIEVGEQKSPYTADLDSFAWRNVR